MVRGIWLGLVMVLIATPAAADIGEPVKIAAPASVASAPSYKFFKSGADRQQPGAYWNPCDTITYGIDFRSATKRGLSKTWEKRRWQSAIAELSAASGLRFTYVGQITTRAAKGRPASVTGVDIPITYGGSRSYRKALKGSIAGVAGVTWSGHRGARRQIDAGYVVIDADEIVRSISSWNQPFDARPAAQRKPDPVRALYLHEFGHALGLEHVGDNRQIMYPKLSTTRPDMLGAGDVAGLRKLGRQRCF